MSVRPVTVLEVGTSRTVALVGDAAPDGSVRLLGLGQCGTAGMRKSRVSDRAQVADCVAAALRGAHEDAGCAINSVVLLCSLGDVRDEAVLAAVDVEGGEDGVEDAAARAAADAALGAAATAPAGRISLGLFPAGYSRDDDATRVLDPVELHARRLAAHGLYLHTDDNLLGDLVDAVQLKSGATVEEEFFTGLAAASVSLAPEQKRDGALLIDFGAGATCWCGYAGGVPVCGGSLAVGGDHVTNDVFLAFRTGSRQTAERLKVEHATVDLGSVGRGERVALPGPYGPGGREIYRFALAQVVEVRMRETLEITASARSSSPAAARTWRGCRRWSPTSSAPRARRRRSQAATSGSTPTPRASPPPGAGSARPSSARAGGTRRGAAASSGGCWAARRRTPRKDLP